MEIRWQVFSALALWALFLFSSVPALAQDVRTGVEQLASQIAKAAPEGKQLRVAVADFPDLQGVTSDLGRYVASRLTTRLAQTGKFWVIERQRLGQVLAELKFSMSDLVDPTKAKELGRMAGVEAIVVGTVSDLGNQVDLDVRMIDIETTRMLVAAATTISKDQVVADMLQRGRVAGMESVGTSATPRGITSSVAADPRVGTLKETASSIAKKGLAFRDDYDQGGAFSLISEYNLLVRKAKSLFKEDPYVQALEETKTQHGKYSDLAQRAGRLARELEIYFTSFDVAKSLGETARSIAERGQAFRDDYDQGGAFNLVVEYNLLVRKAKALFSGDKYVQSLEETDTMGTYRSIAERVTRLADELKRVLARR